MYLKSRTRTTKARFVEIVKAKALSETSMYNGKIIEFYWHHRATV